MKKTKKVSKKTKISKIDHAVIIKKVKTKKKSSIKKKRRIENIALLKKQMAFSRTKRNRAICAYRAKRLLYMFLSLTLGLLISGFLLGILEKVYLENNFKMGIIPRTHPFFGMSLFLDPAFFVLILGAGIAFGIWLGFWGWRVVYIQHKHRIFRKKTC